ncbi:MAG TPA: glycosyltransferase family 4 protein [Mycobacteriales bacterium]|nr:glycosyltransferase family 4 protein [Mycobacteriales bacterium]
MRVLMLSWEYPPLLVGGLGRHVHALAEATARAGHEVTVLTRHPGPGPVAYDEVVGGVRVVRVPEDPPLLRFEDELLAWAMALNHALTRAGLAVCATDPPDVLHAHDWLVAHAATTLKHHLGVPLVATLHATEAGRHQGWLPGPLNRSIHSVEWWLTYEARRVVACSGYMGWEVTRLFDLPPDKVDVVPNGVDPRPWQVPAERVAAARRRWAGDGPLVAFSGRLVYEKGVQDLLAALPRLRRRHPGLRLVVAGRGPSGDELVAAARRLRLGRAVTFAGFVPDSELAALVAAADCAVVPSRYEPFGLVALEAAAAGTPVVASDAGGLAEFVRDRETGLTFPAGDPAALAAAVGELLADQVLGRRLARQARARLRREHSWSGVAERTADVYARAESQERALRAGLAARAVPRLVVRDGNLLTDRLATSPQD